MLKNTLKFNRKLFETPLVVKGLTTRGVACLGWRDGSGTFFACFSPKYAEDDAGGGASACFAGLNRRIFAGWSLFAGRFASLGTCCLHTSVKNLKISRMTRPHPLRWRHHTEEGLLWGAVVLAGAAPGADAALGRPCWAAAASLASFLEENAKKRGAVLRGREGCAIIER